MNKTSRLIFTKGRMIHVTLAPRILQLESQSKARPLETDEMKCFCQRLSLRECSVLDCIVLGECQRRGLGRPKVGERRYVAVEAIVCADVMAYELDLSEIGAQIDEAKWERGE